jgi:hypothetical protein
MLQPNVSSLRKISVKILNRVFYLPYRDLVLVSNIVPVFKASIFGTKNPKIAMILLSASMLVLAIASNKRLLSPQSLYTLLKYSGRANTLLSMYSTQNSLLKKAGFVIC